MQSTTNPYLTKKEVYEELFSIMERLSPNGDTRHIHAEIESMLTSLFNNSKDAMKRMTIIKANHKKGIVPASPFNFVASIDVKQTSSDEQTSEKQITKMSQMPSAQNTVNATQNTRKNRKYGADAYNKSIGEEIEKKTAITVDERKNEHIEVIAEDTIQKIIQKNKMSHIKSGEGKTLSTADQQFDQQEETGYSKLFDLYNRGIESAKEEFGNVQSFIEHVASLGSEISGNEWPDTWLNFEKIMN